MYTGQVRDIMVEMVYMGQVGDIMVEMVYTGQVRDIMVEMVYPGQVVDIMVEMVYLGTGGGDGQDDGSDGGAGGGNRNVCTPSQRIRFSTLSDHLCSFLARRKAGWESCTVSLSMFYPCAVTDVGVLRSRAASQTRV